VLLVCEIKQPGIEGLLRDVVLEADALADVMVWSFFAQALEGMRRAEPRIPCALLIAPQALPEWPRMRETAVRLGLQGVSVFFAGWTRSSPAIASAAAWPCTHGRATQPRRSSAS
jgi:hypothetical protein